MMGPVDIIILAFIGVAFVAVCVRIYRKGSCADCAEGVCTGHCSSRTRRACPAAKGVDAVARDLGEGVK